MYVSTDHPIGEYISPFGSRFTLAPGRRTHVSVEDGFWLANHAHITIHFESPEEEAKCAELNHRSHLNPLGAVPRPQYGNPNATLHMEGYAERIPVLVVNPVGLLAEQQPTYGFGTPNVSLILDKDMIRQVVEDIVAATNAAPMAPFPEVPAEVPASDTDLAPHAPASDPVPLAGRKRGKGNQPETGVSYSEL